MLTFCVRTPAAENDGTSVRSCLVIKDSANEELWICEL